MNSGDEWWTDTIRFDAANLGYVMLQLPRIDLPELEYQGVKFDPKQELHCSLLCIPELAKFGKDAAAEPALRNFVKAFIESHEVMFEGFGEQLYMCQDAGARSIIVGARVKGVSELFSELRTAFDHLKTLPEPLLHVTLYKYNHRFGIGIHSKEQLQQLCQPISETELTEVRKVTHG